MTWAIENKGYSQRRACGLVGAAGLPVLLEADRTTRACESGCGNWQPSADASAIADCTFC